MTDRHSVVGADCDDAHNSSMLTRTKIEVCSCDSPCYRASAVRLVECDTRRMFTHSAETVAIDVRKSGRVDWNVVLDIKWGMLLEEQEDGLRRVHRFEPPRRVVIYTKNRRFPQPPKASEVRRHLGPVTRCMAQLDA
jgi:hypothetical protein